MDLDDFLEAQGAAPAATSAFTAVLEVIPDRPDEVKVTPYRDEGGCGCSSSFALRKAMIRSVKPSGKFHLCCGKRLEVVEIEFAEDASIPVTDLFRRAARPSEHAHAPAPYAMAGSMGPPRGGVAPPGSAASRARIGPGGGIVGRWPIPWTPCEIHCIEVCTQFCSDVGWDCCGWETRCAVVCDGYAA